MFYGLIRFIKNLLPKRLFYRALLIVAIPVIVIQLIITIVFFDSLWIKTNKGMTRALVNEINTFIEVYKNDNYDKKEIANLFSVYLDLNIEFIQDENFNYIYDERWFSPLDRALRRELKSRFTNEGYWFNTTNQHTRALCQARVKLGGTVCLLITMNKRNSIRSPSLRRTTLTGGRVKRADKMQN